MNIRAIQVMLIFLASSLVEVTVAQEIATSHWESQKIRGTRCLPYNTYHGSPYLNDLWAPGRVEFTDGEIADSLNLRYSSYKDEIVYYNEAVRTQIVIDKASLNGFSFTEKGGVERFFRKQYFENYQKADRYFEVLSKGETDLLVFRKVSLDGTSPYIDKDNRMKNQEYNTNYQYYFYSPERQYTSVKITQAGLLSKFDKASQKPVKKLLRKSKIRIDGETGFIQAWKVVEKEGYKVVF